MLKKVLIIIFIFMFFSESITAQESPAKEYNDEASEYFKKGDWEKAVTSCKNGIEKDPKYLPNYFGLGRLYAILNKPRDAVAIFNKALDIDPNYAAAYLGLGAAYTDLREYQKGIATLKKAIYIKPDNSNAYVALARIYMKIAQFKEALSLLEIAKGIDADYGDIYAVFGDVYRCLNQIEKAKENYQEGIAVYRSQGFDGLAKGYEKKLENADNSYVIVYFKPEHRGIVQGVVIENAENYLKVKGDEYLDLGGGFVVGEGGEKRIDKKDIDYIELKP